MPRRSLLPDEDPSGAGFDGLTEPTSEGIRATNHHGLIRQWAARHDAEPATGEATQSGPATRNVQDGGAGIRFNFPGAAVFRPITWDEWFQNFTQHDLMFVYEEDVPGRAPSTRYRLVPRQKLLEQRSLR